MKKVYLVEYSVDSGPWVIWSSRFYHTETRCKQRLKTARKSGGDKVQFRIAEYVRKESTEQ